MPNRKKHRSQFPTGNQKSTPATQSTPDPSTAQSLQSRNEIMTFDSRTLGTPVYERLSDLKIKTRDEPRRRKQKSMAQELYTYLSTWGLMRLKAEETILRDG